MNKIKMQTTLILFGLLSGVLWGTVVCLYRNTIKPDKITYTDSDIEDDFGF